MFRNFTVTRQTTWVIWRETNQSNHNDLIAAAPHMHNDHVLHAAPLKRRLAGTLAAPDFSGIRTQPCSFLLLSLIIYYNITISNIVWNACYDMISCKSVLYLWACVPKFMFWNYTSCFTVKPSLPIMPCTVWVNLISTTDSNLWWQPAATHMDNSKWIVINI